MPPPEFLTDADFADAPPEFLTDADFGGARPARQKSGFEKYVYDPAGQLLQGLTFGFGDEITAGAGTAFGRDYSSELGTQRADNAQFQAEHPYASVGLQLAGGLAPALLTGGTSLEAQGAGNASRALRLLYGIGKPAEAASTIGSIARTAGTGAALGGLYGYGSGEGGVVNRLENAGVGAAGGGIIGGGLATAGAGVSRVLSSGPAQSAFERLRAIGADESGKLGGDVAGPAGPSAADLALTRKLRGVSPEQLQGAESQLAQALSEGSPLYLPEAVNSPRLNRQARFIANYEPSMEQAQNAIQQRALNAPARVSSILDQVSPERDPFAGASQFRTGAEDVTDAMRSARSSAAAPAYARARDQMPLINSPEMKDALSSKTVKGIIKDIKEEFPSQYGDLPDNHITVLDKVKKRLDADIRAKLKNPTENRDVLHDLQTRRNQLVDAIDSASGLYQEARNVYRGFSGPVNYLEGQAKEPGVLTRILKTNDDNVINAVTSTFNQNANPQKVAQIREAMEIGGKGEEFKAGVRAFLQRMVNGTDDGKRAVRDFIDSDAQRSVLKAALGDGYDDFARKIERETKIFEGKKNYYAGSSTQGNFAEANDSLAASSSLGNLVRSALSPRQTAIKNTDKIVNWITSLESRDSATAKQLARALFDTKEGLAALQRVRPFHQRITGIDSGLSRAEQLGTRAGGAGGGSIRKKKS